MYARIEFRHEPVTKERLVHLLETSFASMRIPDVSQALSEHRRFHEEAPRYVPHVVYAYRPTATALALCFHLSERATEIYVQTTHRELLFILCNDVTRDILRVLEREEGKQQVRVVELYEDSGEPVGITGELPSFLALFREKSSRERVVQGVIIIMSLALMALLVGGLQSNLLTAIVTVFALMLYVLISVTWEWCSNRNKVRWKFDGS